VVVRPLLAFHSGWPITHLFFFFLKKNKTKI